MRLTPSGSHFSASLGIMSVSVLSVVATFVDITVFPEQPP
jgi:hypothetical protein